MQTLHGYTFNEKEWKTLGGNGQSVVATKDGKKYFIKRLSKPKYPSSDKFTGEFKRLKIAECDAWLRLRKDVAKILPGTGSGNIIKPLEYFREGPCFYEITNFVDVASIPYDEIWKESKADKARMMMTVAMSLSQIHQAGIVHGDLDPGNILISRSNAGLLITKIIDFSDAFFAANPPESIMSKDAWWSPEVALYSKFYQDKPKEKEQCKEHIGCKADVFSLGLIFHQYCTKNGEFPKHTQDYPWQDLFAGKALQIDPNIEPEFQKLIKSMLAVEPADRPTMDEVHKYLKAMTPGSVSEPKREETKVSTGTDKKEKLTSDSKPNGLRVGKGKRKDGTAVSSVKRNDRNPKKVDIIFADGKKQIMDEPVARFQQFIE